MNIGIDMTPLQQNDLALIWSRNISGSTSFEVWIKMIGNSSNFKGEILNPGDEDFGVWAWSYYTLDGARGCFAEITKGKRKITSMVEI